MIPKHKKELLLEFHDNKCEQCKSYYNTMDLQIHRINRKGSYEDHRNLKVLCRNCHKLIHSNEFNNVRSK